MDAAAWLAVATWGAIAVISPLVWESSRRPRRSGARWLLVAAALALATLDLAGLLRYGQAPAWLVLVVLALGGGGTLVGLAVGARLVFRARRAERNPSVAPDQLIIEPPRLWIRPLRPGNIGGRGPLARVDEWLAADGPRPTVGWWHNGGLLVDQRGAALVDAAGLRHALPAGITTMLNPSVPRSLFLINDAYHVLARLPITGFSSAALKEFAAAANWRYTTEFVESVHEATVQVDLRRTVVDHAAKEDGAVRRARGSLRRHFHRT
jgi:hypothetical protein